jgi:hypothetical protein
MNQWKILKDEMPPKDGRYLVYVPNYNWIGVSSLRHNKFDDASATHWMPLPEPPK